MDAKRIACLLATAEGATLSTWGALATFGITQAVQPFAFFGRVAAPLMIAYGILKYASAWLTSAYSSGLARGMIVATGVIVAAASLLTLNLPLSIVEAVPALMLASGKNSKHSVDGEPLYRYVSRV